jgi:hypothetical protein
MPVPQIEKPLARGPQAPPGKLGKAVGPAQVAAKATSAVSPVKNKALPVMKTNGKAAEHDPGHGYISVPLSLSAPKDALVFSQEERDTILNLQAFLHKFKSKEETPGTVATFQVDVQDKVPPNQTMLSADHVAKLKEFQTWFKRQRPSAKAG